MLSNILQWAQFTTIRLNKTHINHHIFGPTQHYSCEVKSLRLFTIYFNLLDLWVVLWESGCTNWQISTLWWSGSSSCLIVMHECACRTLMRVAEAADCETSLLHSNWELIGCGWNNMASHGSVETNGPTPEDGKLCSSRASNQLRKVNKHREDPL